MCERGGRTPASVGLLRGVLHRPAWGCCKSKEWNLTGAEGNPTSDEAWPVTSLTSCVLGLCFRNSVNFSGDIRVARNNLCKTEARLWIASFWRGAWDHAALTSGWLPAEFGSLGISERGQSSTLQWTIKRMYHWSYLCWLRSCLW